MDLVLRGAGDSRRVGLFPAAWNPPTLAHLALAEAGLAFADEVLLVLPRVFPHKEFEQASFDLRLEWMVRIAATRAGLGVGVTAGGLFLEMARSLRAADPRIEQVYIVCGQDAAERFLQWPYQRAPGALEQLREFSLLVAPRGTLFALPDLPPGTVHKLIVNPELQEISSTGIRESIRRDEPWTHLVPAEIAVEVGRVYL